MADRKFVKHNENYSASKGEFTFKRQLGCLIIKKIYKDKHLHWVIYTISSYVYYLLRNAVATHYLLGQ